MPKKDYNYQKIFYGVARLLRIKPKDTGTQMVKVFRLPMF